MRLSGVRGVVVVALLLAALGLGVASTHGSASAQAPASDTITTQLQPGWNLIGWMGPDTTAGDLFDKIPALLVVAAWDRDAARYAWARRGGTVPPELAQLMRGQGLFLWVSGSEPVDWTRPASAEGMLLTLAEGYNLVGWAGLDGTPIAEAVGRFGEALVGVSTWNAETQSYERYTRGADDSAEGPAVLNHGDALWVELSEERRWWQSGAAWARFAVEGPVPEERRAELRAEMERVVAFFAERYGIEPPELSVRVVRGFRRVTSSPGEVLIHGTARYPFMGWALAREYFRVVQYALAPGDWASSPAWLQAGTATYVSGLYQQERAGGTVDHLREGWWLTSLGLPRLGDLEGSLAFSATLQPGYEMSALATDWLLRRSDAQAPVTYYRLLSASGSWQEAFTAAFGIDVEELYAAFAEYRMQGSDAPLRHLADAEDAPILAFRGEVAPGAAAALRAEFAALQGLFGDRLWGAPADYTVYVMGDDVSAPPAYPGRSGTGGLRPPCVVRHSAIAVVVDIECRDDFVAAVAALHFHNVRERVAPSESLARPSGDGGPWGPQWLERGAIDYMTHAGKEAAGLESLDLIRQEESIIARDVEAPLGNLGADAESEAAAALRFLAVEWLLQRAGEEALFGYYRRLPLSRSWQAAFVGAFGLRVEEFYAAFEAYRRMFTELPLLPHMIDDRAEPVLRFAGQVSIETTVRLRAEFEDVQAFFRQRFGGGPADYTIYAAADAASAAATYARVRGEALGVEVCRTRSEGVSLVILSCAGPPAVALAGEHFRHLREHLAPLGASERGPHWLLVGGPAYVSSAYRATLGLEALEEARERRIEVARQTTQPLRGMEGTAAAAGSEAALALGFLATDWLAQRAGEPAILEYYRLLGSSRSWREAFTGAFGISVDVFYTAFGRHRQSWEQRVLRHLADDREEPVLVFVGDVPAGTAERLRAEFRELQTFFDERLGGAPADYTLIVAADRAAGASAYAEALGQEPDEPFCSEREIGVAFFLVVTCHDSLPDDLAGHHYFSALERLGPRSGFFTTWYWLHLATLYYVEAAYRAAAGIETFHEARLREIGLAGRTSQPLREMENYYDIVRPWDLGGQALSFLAGEWLAQRVGERAIFEYYRQLASSGSWRTAFAAAFGMRVEEFYDLFEAYRRAVVTALPHLADDRLAPVLELLGEIPLSRAAEIRADFEAFQTLFRDRLGSGPADYTVYVAAAGEAAQTAQFHVFGDPPGTGGNPCAGNNPGVAVYATLNCYNHLPDYLAREHFYNVRDRLAPWAELPSASEGYSARGPEWLEIATIAYLTHAGRAAVGMGPLERSRDAQAALAGGTQALLRSMETDAGVKALPSRVAAALAFLAADRLVQRAGERSLFEYYRRLPTSGSWQQAFAGAFGIGAEAFYEAFEAYRRGEVARPPHFADDLDEPVLVFQGEAPAADAAALREDFRGLLTLFRERFGDAAADYTVYVAADLASAAELPEFESLGTTACDGWVSNVGQLWVLNCPHRTQVATRLPDDLAAWHFGVAARQFSSAPRVLPPAWLLLAGRTYAEAVFRAHRSAVPAATLGAFRREQARVAGETTTALDSFEGVTSRAGAPLNVVTALSFLAADWLVARAGEPALFEYYRLLPTSDSWEEAFGGAFGMAIDDFYAAFAEYRAGL